MPGESHRKTASQRPQNHLKEKHFAADVLYDIKPAEIIVNTRRILGNPFSGPFFQPLWRRLHKLALHRMNYGRGVILYNGEDWVLRHLKRRCEHIKPFVVFDVGANVGHYTAMVLSTFGGRAQVYAFEPNETTYGILKSRHGANESARCYNAGFSDKEETLLLYSHADVSYLSSLYKRHSEQLTVTSSIACTTLDLFCKAERVEMIDLLKMDVEGHELKILAGASHMIQSGRVRYIQFEFGDCNVDSRTFFRDFFELLTPRYTLHRILRRGLEPILEYNESYEIFKGTNYLACSRALTNFPT